MILEKAEATKYFGILFGGEHHIPSELKEWGSGWSVIYRGDLATYDYDMLTRMVVLSHEMCLRGSIANGGPRGLKIIVHKRDRNGDNMSKRHPTLEENIAKIKQFRWPENI